MRTLLATLLVLLLLVPAWAEEPAEPTGSRGVLDVTATLGAAEAEIARQEELTRQGSGLGGSHQSHVRRRLTRMKRRVKDLQKANLSVRDPESDAVHGLEPAKWSPFVRTLAMLHTEIGECVADYRKQKADATWAKKDWVRRFPGPEPVGRVPSRDALDEVERTIFQLEAAGRQVPASLWSARTRLRVQVAEEEERERERLLRAYLEAKRQAFERFEQAAEEENRRTRAEAETLATVMTSLRTLVADAQVLEEERLRGLLPTDEEDATRTREVEELLAKLRKGREKALRFSGSKLSRYGATVQQDWMVHRTKLEALVPKD